MPACLRSPWIDTKPCWNSTRRETQPASRVRRTRSSMRRRLIKKAQDLLAEAQRLQDSKAASSLVVQMAREAAQTAEDSRVIAEKRQQEEKVADLAGGGRQGAARPVAGRKRGAASPHRCRCRPSGRRIPSAPPVRAAEADAADARSRAPEPAPPTVTSLRRASASTAAQADSEKAQIAHASDGTTQWSSRHARYAARPGRDGERCGLQRFAAS